MYLFDLFSYRCAVPCCAFDFCSKNIFYVGFRWWMSECCRALLRRLVSGFPSAIQHEVCADEKDHVIEDVSHFDQYYESNLVIENMGLSM
jgi:hypothetical protein